MFASEDGWKLRANGWVPASKASKRDDNSSLIFWHSEMRELNSEIKAWCDAENDMMVLKDYC